mmetsp:Transcript_15674/g.31350  ORF Transcript_15674/g.31350 Transcript_15674/m.31350 type:complete len:264 (+) Transcript_15674:250-1041(+)
MCCRCNETVCCAASDASSQRGSVHRHGVYERGSHVAAVQLGLLLVHRLLVHRLLLLVQVQQLLVLLLVEVLLLLLLLLVHLLRRRNGHVHRQIDRSPQHGQRGWHGQSLRAEHHGRRLRLMHDGIAVGHRGAVVSLGGGLLQVGVRPGCQWAVFLGVEVWLGLELVVGPEEVVGGGDKHSQHSCEEQREEGPARHVAHPVVGLPEVVGQVHGDRQRHEHRERQHDRGVHEAVGPFSEQLVQVERARVRGQRASGELDGLEEGA